MIKTYLRLLVFSLFLISCNSTEKENVYNTKAIELNNEAVEFLKTEKLDSALICLDKAIKIDPTYYVAYGNMMNVYCKLKDFKNALLVAEKQIEQKPDLAEGWTFAGMLNEKLGDNLKALKYYNKSIEIFDERIANSDKQENLKANRLNRAVSLVLSGEEQKGREELQKLKETYPEDNSLSNFLNITKQEYLKKIFKD